MIGNETKGCKCLLDKVETIITQIDEDLTHLQMLYLVYDRMRKIFRIKIWVEQVSNVTNDELNENVNLGRGKTLNRTVTCSPKL